MKDKERRRRKVGLPQHLSSSSSLPMLKPTPRQQLWLLPPLARGATFTTVGLSQLTTSRQHLGRPALVAAQDEDGWRLDGLCPWVTGADACDTIVTGAAT